MVFTRQLLLQTLGYDAVSVECIALRGERESRSRCHGHSCPNASLQYLLVDVGNDEKVLSAALERCPGLSQRGYKLVIGLRDMYSAKYESLSPCTIDKAVNTQFIDATQDAIKRKGYADRMYVAFAVMELEAWILGMHTLLEKVDKRLTCANIASQLGIDLSTVCPETEFYHPTIQLGQILDLAGIKYNKSIDQMEKIFAQLSRDDLAAALKDGKGSDSLAKYMAKLQCNGDSDG